VLDVEGFPILRHWYAVYPAGRQLSVVARAFLDYLLSRGRRHLLRRVRKNSWAEWNVHLSSVRFN
jgi:hypothetical protein